jgi:DNA-binding LytR/AlgR family response regulator
MEKSISYILADDDILYAELTTMHLQLIPNLHCIGICKDAFEAKTLLQQNLPDLLILDVEMPGLSGIQLAKSLTQLPIIIFISSHSTYAADAFDVDAVDYLVKPVAIERLIRAVDKARLLVEMKQSIAAPDGFRVAADDSFFIKEKNSFIRINYADVSYIESLGDFVNILLQNGEKKIALVSLKNLEQQLPAAQFIRISRTQMVNKNKITAIDNIAVSLDKIVLNIGKTYSETVLQSVLGNTAIKRFI